MTSDLNRRMSEHNTGTDRKAHTRRHRPWNLEYFVLAETEDVARTAELYFKNTSGKEKFTRFADANPDHPNPIKGFFEAQDVGRVFGRSGFKVGWEVVVMQSC